MACICNLSKNNNFKAYICLFVLFFKKKDKYGIGCQIFFRDTIVPTLFYRGSKYKNCVVARSKGWFFIYCVFFTCGFKNFFLDWSFLLAVYTDIQGLNPPQLLGFSYILNIPLAYTNLGTYNKFMLKRSHKLYYFFSKL